MSKRSTYRSEEKDFEKYFGDELSEQERHDMERQALEDGFEAEAMEGWEEVPVKVAQADMADLRERLSTAPAKQSFSWFKIAAAVALLVVASWAVLNRFNQQPDILAQEKSSSKEVEEAPVNANATAPEPQVTVETTDPEPVLEEAISEEDIETVEKVFEESKLMASSNIKVLDNDLTERASAPKLQAKSEITEELVAADLDVSALNIVEAEREAPVQVLSAEGQEQTGVDFRPGEQLYSVTEDDLFEIKSKDNWSFRQIHGNVLDEEGQIVSDARIVLNGTSILAVSDFNGKFEMAVPDSLTAPTLTFSSTGFSQLNYSINTTDTFDVVMAREDQPNLNTALLSRDASNRTNYFSTDETYDDSGFAAAAPEDGFKQYEKYLKKNTRRPRLARQQGIKGTVVVSVKVGTTGELSDIKVIQGLGAGCDEEAIRVVKEGPSWNPAKSGGQEIEVTTEIEVKFD